MVAHTRLNPFAGASAPINTTEITQLRIYPIKSCRGIRVTNSYITRQGLDLDRRWMFVDAKTSKFITIRDISALTLIDTALTEPHSSRSNADTADTAAVNGAHAFTGRAEDQHLTISIRGTSKSVTVPARPTSDWLAKHTTLSPVRIWNSDTDGYVYSDAVNSIFSDFLSQPVKLVYKGPTQRVCAGNGAPDRLGRKETVNFPDVLPLQIANEASLAELNARLRDKGHRPITVEHFRPNIVVRGGPLHSPDANRSGHADPARNPADQPAASAPASWSEDSWKTVRVVADPDAAAKSSWLAGATAWLSGVGTKTGGAGDPTIDIDVVARCARCQVPNVDPETADKDAHEPWDTLVSYRRVDEGIKWKPCFGMLSCPRGEGRVAVGMRFEVLEMTEGHYYEKGF